MGVLGTYLSFIRFSHSVFALPFALTGALLAWQQAPFAWRQVLWVIVAMVAAEFPLVQPHLYDTQTPPVVYLSGTLMFVGGLTVVRVHNRWKRDWTALVTLSGWFFLVLGLFRMFAAGAYQRSSANTSAMTFMVLEGLLAILGLVMTFQAYRRDRM